MELVEVEGRTAVDVEGVDFDFVDSFDVDEEAVGGAEAADFVPEKEDRTPQPTPSADNAACPCDAIPIYFSAVFCRPQINLMHHAVSRDELTLKTAGLSPRYGVSNARSPRIGGQFGEAELLSDSSVSAMTNPPILNPFR